LRSTQAPLEITKITHSTNACFIPRIVSAIIKVWQRRKEAMIMFDTVRIGQTIKALRQKKDLTQMNLADELGVSYQAVSNWERGNSMPDISKLKDLAGVLGCTIDELLGNSPETEWVKSTINAEDVSQPAESPDLATLANVAPLLKPTQAESLLERTLNSLSSLSIEDVIPLAPFLSDEYLDQLIDQVDVTDSGVRSVAGLAPFLNDKSLERLVDKMIAAGQADRCQSLYPFLSQGVLQKLATELVKKGGVKALSSLAPFLS
jgi:transcriptional regulator with XRE-family HTH domain